MRGAERDDFLSCKHSLLMQSNTVQIQAPRRAELGGFIPAKYDTDRFHTFVKASEREKDSYTEKNFLYILFLFPLLEST